MRVLSVSGTDAGDPFGTVSVSTELSSPFLDVKLNMVLTTAFPFLHYLERVSVNA